MKIRIIESPVENEKERGGILKFIHSQGSGWDKFYNDELAEKDLFYKHWHIVMEEKKAFIGHCHVCQDIKNPELAHLYFRYIAGSVKRYIDWGCEWMLDKKQAGGGCSINLGIHYIDLFNYITREPAKRIAASMNNKISQTDVEETSSIILTSETGVIGVVETGYGVPGNGADSYFSIITSNHFMTVRDGKFVINSQNGQVKEMPAGSTSYASFVKETLTAFRLGKAPCAGLMDAYEALKLLDWAYRESHG